MTLYIAIRLRGSVDVRPEVSHTLNLLRLRRKYTASLYHDSQPHALGILKKAENWIAWGEIDKPTLVELLRKRGRLVGDKPLTDERVRGKLGLDGIEDLAQKLLEGSLHLNKLESYGIKPFFRLHPPKGGFRRSTKRMYSDGGILGYWDGNIRELLVKMI